MTMARGRIPIFISEPWLEKELAEAQLRHDKQCAAAGPDDGVPFMVVQVFRQDERPNKFTFFIPPEDFRKIAATARVCGA